MTTIQLLRGGVSARALTGFTSQLSTLQDAGLPIVRSLRILEGQMKQGMLRDTLAEIALDVESGCTFSEALAKHPRIFDPLYVNMVRAGEAGGVLDTILRRLAEFMEKSQKLKRQVIGAAVYPAVVLMVAAGILSLIMLLVVPEFVAIFADIGADLPFPTVVLITLSDVLRRQWFLLPGLLAVLVAAWRFCRASPGGRYLLDSLALRLPVFGAIVEKSSVSRLTRTLGTLIRSGVPLLEALAIVRGSIGNSVVARAITDVHDSVREGESIAEPLAACGVFDDIVVNMIDVGEETGELDRMLIKIADNYDEEVDVAVASLVSLLEPLMIVGMGAAIGFIVVALFLPLIALVEKL